MINEDQYGMPMISSQIGATQPGVGNDMYNAGPEFDQGGIDEQPDFVTAMSQCAATGCVHNEAGLCALETIDISDCGGCVQYEAKAECGHDHSDGDDSRYGEQETNVNGDSGAGQYSSQPQQMKPQQMSSEPDRHWRASR